MWPFNKKEETTPRRKQLSETQDNFMSIKEVRENVDSLKIANNKDLDVTSIIMGPVSWLAENLSNIPIDIYNDNNERIEDDRAKMMRDLISNQLIYAVGFSYTLYGNAFIRVSRDGSGIPTTLEFLDYSWVSTEADSDGRLVRYKINPPGRTVTEYVLPGDIIHIKKGIDPNCPLMGRSPLAALLPEVKADIEAASIVNNVLKNRGILGVVMAPKDEDYGLDEEDAEAMQKKLTENYTGLNRGKAYVSPVPIELLSIQVDVDKFALRDIRGISESRVCAVLNIPAAVVGFNVGLNQIKVGATLREQRLQTWENVVIPTFEEMFDEINRTVAVAFRRNAEVDDIRYGYKLPAVIIADRARSFYRDGGLTLNEFREAIGYPPVTGGDSVFSLTRREGRPGGENEEVNASTDPDNNANFD